jgi:bacterioferritin (cytochrome b1)
MKKQLNKQVELSEAVTTFKTPQDVFDYYIKTWDGCPVNKADMQEAFDLGLEGKELAYDFYSDDRDPVEIEYMDMINGIAIDIRNRGVAEFTKHLKVEESADFDGMVEALEANEGMVECKECFDLFPKAECLKAKMGYVCPACGRAGMIYKAEGDPSRVRPNITTGLFDQEFPEVGDYDPGTVKDWKKESTIGDALENTLAGLIDDEAKAAADYAETVEDVEEVEPENKEEILNTLNHIKKEEEEHIEELKDLSNKDEDVDKDLDELFDANISLGLNGGENNDVSVLSSLDSEAEDKEKLNELFDADVNLSLHGGSGNNVRVLSPLGEANEEDALEEDEPDAEDEPDTEEIEEDSEDLETAYQAALELANEKGIGQVFGYAKKDTEEFVAIDPFEVDDPEAVEDDLMAAYDDVAYAYVAYPESALEEALFENVQLHEGPIRFLKDTGHAVGHAVKHLMSKDAGKVLDKFFYNGYTILFFPAKQGAKLPMPEEQKEEHQTLDQALTAADKYSEEYPEFKVYVYANEIELDELTPRLKRFADIKNGYGALMAMYRNGNPISNNAKQKAEDLTKILRDNKDLMKTIGKNAAGYKADSDTDDSDTKEDLKELKKKAQELLGSPKKADGYTTESYEQYKEAYKQILAAIVAAKSKEDLEKIDIEARKKEAENLLKAASDEPGLDPEEDEDDLILDDDSLDEAKDKAKEKLGPKQDPERFTEASYQKYESNYNKVIAFIDSRTTVEAVEKIDIEKYKAQLNKYLKLKPVENPPSDDTDDTPVDDTPVDDGSDDTPSDEDPEPKDEEEPTDDTDDDTGNDDETPADSVGKLSDVSEEQLKKLYTAVTGQGVGDNKRWRKTMTRMRAKLKELGESLNPNDYKPEDFLEEDLQSEADAVKNLKDTTTTLQNTAKSLKNMASAMREEYHKFANPAELHAMQEVENLVVNVLSNIYSDIAAWGYEAEEVDGQSFMSQENEACLQYMLVFKDLDADEVEDLADQLEMQLENELSVYKPVPEILGVAGSVALPDYDLAEAEDDAEGITRASIMIYVTFARNLY